MKLAPDLPKRLALAISHDGRPKGEIAKAVKMHRQVLTNILAGRGGQKYIDKLARELKVERAWLTEGVNPPVWLPEKPIWQNAMSQMGAQKYARMEEKGRHSALIIEMLLQASIATKDEAIRKGCNEAMVWFMGQMYGHGTDAAALRATLAAVRDTEVPASEKAPS